MWGFTIGLAAALFAIFSREAMSAAAEAAALFARGVMPALFPMLVLSSLPVRGRREPLCLALAFSLLAGSPASMKRVRGLYDAGEASGARLTALLGATGVMSPMFFLGTLAAWTGQPGAARRMLLAHWAGAALAGLAGGAAHRLYNAGRRGTREERMPQVREPHSTDDGRITCADSRPGSVMRALPAALGSAAQSLLAICAAMMLFSIVAAILRVLLTRALPEWTAANAALLAALWATLEIGGGSAELVRLGASLPLVCAMCGFGGLSLLMQNLLFTGDMTPPARLIALRAAHAAFSYAICTVIM